MRKGSGHSWPDRGNRERHASATSYQKYQADRSLAANASHIQFVDAVETALEGTKNVTDLRECFPKEVSAAEVSMSSLLSWLQQLSELSLSSRTSFPFCPCESGKLITLTDSSIHIQVSEIVCRVFKARRIVSRSRYGRHMAVFGDWCFHTYRFQLVLEIPMTRYSMYSTVPSKFCSNAIQ